MLQTNSKACVDDTVRLKYDIFEDICFERFIDSEYDNCKGNYDDFFLKLEELERCIYRRYQIWVENKLFTKGNREKFLFKLLDTDTVPNDWKTQTVVGIVKSNFCGEFIEEYYSGSEFSYKYFLKDSFRYSLHSFMYHEENGEERYAHDDLMNIVLLFDSVNEKNEFERYVEYHIQNLRDRVDAQNEYSYVRADSEAETRFIIHRLRTARVLQSILKEYREWVKNHC